MSLEVRTLELVTDSSKSISDLKSFESAIDSLSAKLLAFNAAKDKAFKSLSSDWTRLGKQLKPIKLEVSYAGLAPKFRQFQSHLLNHLRETQALVNQHKIVLSTVASTTGAAQAARGSVATAQKQLSGQALFQSVMGKQYANQDLTRIQSQKQLERMRMDMTPLLQKYWLMQENDIQNFKQRFDKLNLDQQKEMNAMLRQTFSPGMAAGRAQRQAGWISDIAKQEGWNQQIMQPFMRDISQKQKFVKEDPSKQALIEQARQWYLAQGGKPGQRQMGFDDLALSASAAWYKDPKLIGPQRNVFNEIASGQYQRSQVIASRSHLRGGQYVDLLAQADKNIIRRDFSDLRSSLSINQPTTAFTKENLTQGKVMRHPDDLKGFINKQFGLYEDNRDKLLERVKKDLEALDLKQYFEIDDATYDREHKRLTAEAKRIQKDQYGFKKASAITHDQRQSDLEYAFRNHPFQEVGAYNQDISTRLIDELYGTKAKRLETLQSKIDDSERTDIEKRANFLQKEIDLINHKKLMIEKATEALTKENQVASQGTILAKAHEIESNLLRQNDLYEKRGKLLDHLQMIEKRAIQYADVDTVGKSKDLQKRLATTRETIIDPTNTQQVNQFANEINRAEKETNNLQKSFDRTHKSGGIMNSVLGKTGMLLTAIAASIFILQNIAMWIQAALAPTLEFEGALRKLDQQNDLLKEDYAALSIIIEDAFTSGAMSIEAATGKFQQMRDAGYTTQEAIVSVQREMARLNDINLDSAVGQLDRLAGAIKNLLNVKGNWLGNLVGAAADKVLYMGATKEQQNAYDKLQKEIDQINTGLKGAKFFQNMGLPLDKTIAEKEARIKVLQDTQQLMINPVANKPDAWQGQKSEDLVQMNYSGGMPQSKTDQYNAAIRAEEVVLQNEKDKIKEETQALQEIQNALKKHAENMQIFQQIQEGSGQNIWNTLPKEKREEFVNQKHYYTGLNKDNLDQVLENYLYETLKRNVLTPSEFSALQTYKEKITSSWEKESKSLASAQEKAFKEKEKVEREHMEAFKQSLKIAESKWDYSSDSPQDYFKSVLESKGFKIDSEEKQRLFQAAVDKFNNKIVSWQNAFGKAAADNTLEIALAKTEAMRKKAVAANLDLNKSYPHLTGTKGTLNEFFNNQDIQHYKQSIEDEFAWAFKSTYGVSEKEAERTKEKYESYRDSILESGPLGAQQSQLRRINAIEEDAKKYHGYLESIDAKLSGTMTVQDFLNYQKQRISEGSVFSQYEQAFFKQAPYGGLEDMTEKEKNIFEKQGHFTEMASAALKDYADEAEKTATKTYQAFQNAFSQMADALTEFVMTGKMEWKSLADSIIREIVRIQMQQLSGNMATATSGLIDAGVSLLGSFFSPGALSSSQVAVQTGASATIPSGLLNAKGNMFNRYGLIPFATGGIVTKPTVFAFGKGGANLGIMGEAGPEAIMPVTRTSNGELGVKAVGSQMQNMIINIIEAPGTKATVKPSEDGKSMDVIIERVEAAMTNRMNRGTGLAPYLNSRYRQNR